MLLQKFFGRKKDEPSSAVPMAEKTISFSVDWPAATPTQTGEFRNARLLLTDVGPLSAQDVQDLHQAVGDASNPLVLVAPGYMPDSLPVLARFGMIPVCASDLGVERMDELLADLAMLTRGRVLAAAMGTGIRHTAAPVKTDAGLLIPGLGWSDVRADDLGTAELVVLGETSLTVRTGPPRELETHLQGLLKQFQYALHDMEREAIGRRFVRFGRSPGSPSPAQDDLKIPPNAMTVRGGYASSYFVTDPSRGLADLKNVRLLAVDFELTDMEQLGGIVDRALAGQCLPLVVAARSVKGSALSFLAVNKLRGILPVVAVRILPEQNQIGNPIKKLVDATGGIWISTAGELGALQGPGLGRAARVISSRSWTIVVP